MFKRLIISVYNIDRIGHTLLSAVDLAALTQTEFTMLRVLPLFWPSHKCFSDRTFSESNLPAIILPGSFGIDLEKKFKAFYKSQIIVSFTSYSQRLCS